MQYKLENCVLTLTEYDDGEGMNYAYELIFEPYIPTSPSPQCYSVD